MLGDTILESNSDRLCCLPVHVDSTALDTKNGGGSVISMTPVQRLSFWTGQVRIWVRRMFLRVGSRTSFRQGGSKPIPVCTTPPLATMLGTSSLPRVA